jgi:integrase
MPRKKTKRQNRARGWGSVGQGPGGDWWAQIPRRMDEKRPIRRGFATADAAHDWLDEQIKAWLEGRDRTAERPFGVYLDQWLDRREPFLAESVRRGYRRAVEMAKSGDDGRMALLPFSQITHEHLGDLYADWRRQEYALSTIRKLRTVLSAAFNDAVPNLIPTNPNLKARVPKPQLDITCWNLDQRNAYLRWVYGTPRYALWLLFLTLGPRPEELRGLKKTDLDRESRRLTISRGLSDDGVEEGPTKSRRERKVILHAPLYAAMVDLIDHGPEGPWLFANPETGEPWHRTSLGRELARGIEALKLTEIRLYDCRHTAATIALAKSGPIADVSYMLGHANPSVTLEYYSHWLPSGQEWLARLIGETVPAMEPPSEQRRAS